MPLPADHARIVGPEAPCIAYLQRQRAVITLVDPLRQFADRRDAAHEDQVLVLMQGSIEIRREKTIRCACFDYLAVLRVVGGVAKDCPVVAAHAPQEIGVVGCPEILCMLTLGLFILGGKAGRWIESSSRGLESLQEAIQNATLFAKHVKLVHESALVKREE